MRLKGFASVAAFVVGAAACIAIVSGRHQLIPCNGSCLSFPNSGVVGLPADPRAATVADIDVWARQNAPAGYGGDFESGTGISVWLTADLTAQTLRKYVAGLPANAQFSISFKQVRYPIVSLEALAAQIGTLDDSGLKIVSSQVLPSYNKVAVVSDGGTKKQIATFRSEHSISEVNLDTHGLPPPDDD